MSHFNFGLSSKVAALLVSSVLLTGCYKIEMKETLNLDGTSDIALKMDLSGMATAMTGMAMSMGESLESSLATMEPEITGPTFESCSDPALIEYYGAVGLEGPETIVSTVTAEKITTCLPSENEGMVNIEVDNIDTMTGESLFGETVERRADSCNAPALLAFYQVDNFDNPIVEPFSINKTVDISCSDIREEEIQVNTLTQFDGQPNSEPKLERFLKTTPEVIPENTLAELDALTLATEEMENGITQSMETDMNVCEDNDTSPEDLPFFFTKCESPAPGVGIFHYTKYDTTGFKINSNGTVTYNLQPSTESFNDTVNAELDASSEETQEMSPAMFGFEVDYVLVSPWPILEHSTGVLEDEYTLRVDLLQTQSIEALSVTLDTDGSTIEMLSPQTQLQIDQLIDSLEEQLLASDAPTTRQIEYIFHLSNKIQRLAAIRPEQQVPLGYLQTQLISLAEDLESRSFEDLDEGFMEAVENLDISEESMSQTESNTAEDEATLETNLEAESNLEMEENRAPSPAEIPAPLSEPAPIMDENIDPSPAEIPDSLTEPAPIMDENIEPSPVEIPAPTEDLPFMEDPAPTLEAEIDASAEVQIDQTIITE